jgi:predicted PurR-regulated permease PerM
VLAFLSGSDSIAATSIFSAAAHVFSSIANAFFGFIFALYILVSKERLRRQGGKLLRAWLPERAATITSRILKRASKIFSKFVSGQCIEAVIIGTLTGLGALAINPHYAVMLGVLIGFLALIPIIGAFIGVVVGALILFMESPWQALAFVIFILVLQQIEGNLIYPRVVGKSIGLPGMWVLFAVLVGGGVGGIFGIVIGVPLSALIYSLLREATEMRLQRKRLKSVGSALRSDS